MDHVEPILKEDPFRFVLFPIKYPDIFHYYEKALASIWTAHEVSFVDDVIQWPKLDADTQRFVKYILAFFAGVDGIINENLAMRFYGEVQVAEIRCFYGFQIAMENIHNETYSRMIDTYIMNAKERQHIFQALETIPSIKRMGEWSMNWLRSERPFCERLIAFACVEGILFCGPFAAIFWLKKRNLLPGLAMANELISRDETLHMDFACHLHRKLERPASEEVVHQIVREIVDLSVEFINEAVPCRLIGMNSSSMAQYIKFIADRMLGKLNCKAIYKVDNPFDWMDLISMENKTNFFERRVSEYSRANLCVKDGDGEIGLVEDF